VELRGRAREQQALERLLADVREGRSRTLTLRGEAGAGKTALLDHLAERATGCRVARAAGVEPETQIAFSALQQLCAPLLGDLGRLPALQRAALATAFGLQPGEPPDTLRLGLAVLGLFAEAAAERPLVCLVDDAQWLDRMSEVILGFVARRLDAESVALVFACRTPGDEDVLTGLPGLRIDGLADADAHALLATALRGPVDARVRDRIIAETRGNPLALLELPRGLNAAELAFGFAGQRAMAGPGAKTVVSRVEEGFRRRIAALPEDTRRLLLTAAVEPIGDVLLLWRALERLDVGPEAVTAAEDAGLIELGARVRFRHPLVRSAAWRAADATGLRAAHAALAEATDPARDPDRRAWHRAHAALGPDEEVATELEESAGRALSRGGRSAAAAFYERAAELTLDPGRRATLLLAAARARIDAGAPALVPDLLAAAELGRLDPLLRAQIERMRAHIAFVLNPGAAAGPPLLAAARRLETLDAEGARHAYLMALGGGVHAGRFGGDYLQAAAQAARAAPAGDDFRGLLLTAVATWVLDGPAVAAPLLRRALAAPAEPVDYGFLFVAMPAADEIFAGDATAELSDRALQFARGTGVQALLPTALSFKAGRLLYAGRLADAAALLDEADALSQATGISYPASSSLMLAAYRGRERTALELLDATTADALARNEGLRYAQAGLARAVLFNGLGRYSEALSVEITKYSDLSVYPWALAEQVEAATRVGDVARATEARDLLAPRTRAAGTDWARGVQSLADALVAAEPEADHRAAIERLAGVPLLLARARLLFGEWLRRANRRRDARDELHAAYESFIGMGAEGFAERAGRELSATGETVRRRVAAPAAEKLTAQEAHIVRLAVAGRTNPEIAAELFLSPRTVEWHLRKIFTKLGVGSRRELAGALRDR
jgi:DNA-binding CsgD family transcriptional regulator